MSKEDHWNTYDVSQIGAGAYTDIKRLKEVVADKDVLEVGCGRGGSLIHLAESRSRAGIDPSSIAIDHASATAPQIDWKVGYAEELPFEDAHFDVVYSLEVIEHVAEYDKMLIEISRVLRPGGTLFIQTPNYPAKRVYDFLYWVAGRRTSLADDYTHVTKLSAGVLARAVSVKLTVEHVYTRNILFDQRLGLLRSKFFKEYLGRWIGQKTIVIATKPESK